MHLLSVSTFILASTTAGSLLPIPPGKHNVTLTLGTLVDHKHDNRELMLSVFQPATCTSTIPVEYMPNKTAAYQGPYIQQQFNTTADFTPVFQDARLPVCPSDAPKSICKPLEDDTDVPIVLLGPGWGIPRLYYSAIASALASTGLTVITIDHPGEANIITYPDGHTVYGAKPGSPTPGEYVQLALARAQDASFVIDQLGNASAMASLLPQRGAKKFCTDRVAMVGHSLGGAAAVIAAGRDTRIRAAIDWDGSLFGTLPTNGLSTPVLYVSEDTAPAGGERDPTWVSIWPQLTGPKLWVEVKNTTHMSFSDAPVLLEAAGQDPSLFADLLGTIAAKEVVDIMVAYAKEWVGGAFRGEMMGVLLEGREEGTFPEVKVIAREGF